MKKIACLCVICAVAVMGGGCASVGYFKDRGRDAADIFTLTGGWGLGVKVRVGPVRTGLLFKHFELIGLRGGILVPIGASLRDSEYFGDWYFSPPFAVLDRTHDYGLGTTAEEEFFPDTLGRGKGIYIAAVLGSDRPFLHPFLAEPEEVGACYYTQIEALVALGPSVRAGFNPGELLDFVLGWFMIDIYGDDIGRRTSKDDVEPP